MTCRVLLSAICLVAVAPRVAFALGDSLNAEKCAAAINGDVEGDVRVYCGMTRRQLDALVDRLLGALEKREAARQAEAAGVTRFAVIGLARRVAVDTDVQTVDQALTELERAVEIAIESQQSERPAQAEGNSVPAVLARVAALSERGWFDDAAAETDRAFAAWEASQGPGAPGDRKDGLRLLEAGLRQDLLRRDASSAADRIVQRATLEAPEDLFGAICAAQQEWYDRGRDRGLALDLEVSIELARRCTEHAGTQDQRGAALTNLGNALWVLGGRESGTDHLDEAVTAYRSALEIRTRNRVPLDWAETQVNLGVALKDLGERRTDNAQLEEAVATLRAALEVRTRDRAPADWALTQTNLGSALLALAQRETGIARLEEAVTAFRAALEVQDRAREPLKWASTQSNLGVALGTARRTRNRDGPIGGGRRGLSSGARRAKPRSRPAGLGAVAEQSRRRAAHARRARPGHRPA